MRRSLGVCAIVLCVLVLSFAGKTPPRRFNTATLPGRSPTAGLAVRARK